MPRSPSTEGAPAAAGARKPQARGLRSAQRLLEAATELFLEKGYDETTIDDIVAHAQSAKGTFYHHYESKAALLAALRGQVISDFEAHVDAAMAGCAADDLWLRLDVWIRAACEGYIRMEPLHDLAFSKDAIRWSASDERFMIELVKLLRKGHASGVWMIDNAPLTASFIFRGLVGVIDDLVLAGKRPSAAYRVISALARKAVSAS